MLSQGLSKQFLPAVRRAGQDLFEQGVVTLGVHGNNRGDGFAAATIKTASYIVTPQAQWTADGKLQVFCLCPAYSRKRPCEHIYALLLLCDQEGLLPENALDSAAASDASRAPWKRQLAALANAVSDRNTTPADVPAKPLPTDHELLYILQPHPWHDDGLRLCVMLRNVRKNLAPRRLDLLPSAIAELPEPDRGFISALYGIGNNNEVEYSRRIPHEFDVTEIAAETLLPQLSRSGRLFWRKGSSSPQYPLTWESEPWDVELAVVHDEDRLRVVAQLYTSTGPVPLNQGEAVSFGSSLILGNRAGRLASPQTAKWVSYFLDQKNPIVFPAAELWTVLNGLAKLPDVPALSLPEELQVTQTTPEPQVHVRLSKPQYSYSGYGTEKLQAEVSFSYAQESRWKFNEGPSILLEEKNRGLIWRNRPAERLALQQIQSLGFRADYTSFSIAASKVMPAVLAMVGKGWQVEGEKIGRYRAAGNFNVNLTSGIDWFEVTGSAQFEDQTVDLPTLLSAIRKGEKFVTLGDGSVGVLPEAWIKQAGLLATAGKVEGDTLKFKPSQAAILDILLQQVPQAKWDPQFDAIRSQLQRFEGIRPAEPPATFQGTLRDYQKEGLGWFDFLRQFQLGGCLADDMGLGKTVQVLAMLEERRIGQKKKRPSLVVAPKSLIFNWTAEAKRFTPEMKVLDHTGIGRASRLHELGDYDLVLTTYGTLRLDAPKLKDTRFDYVILDESQAIKNAGTATAKAVRLLEGEHRLALSGTPIENHLKELWSLFEFLNPGMLGGAALFKDLAGSSELNAEMAQVLGKALRPFILRRTKREVAKELPERTEQTIWCELEGDHKKQYAELRDHYRQALLGGGNAMEKQQMQVLEALLRLRQAACHPGLLDEKRAGESSPKLDTILDQIREVTEEGHKALVFSQFTSFLSIVRKQLDKAGIVYEYLDGQTRDRQSRVERFQSDANCKLFLISLKAGGVGLNLTAAEYVFLLDPWWNPAVENQAIDRAHRIGQDKQVFAYRLIAKGTVEEKVLELQERKRDLADAIINASAGPLASLTREDLELLLT